MSLDGRQMSETGNTFVYDGAAIRGDIKTDAFPVTLTIASEDGRCDRTWFFENAELAQRVVNVLSPQIAAVRAKDAEASECRRMGEVTA